MLYFSECINVTKCILIFYYKLKFYTIYKCISKSGTNFISQPKSSHVNIIVDINFSNGGKHLLLHKHLWINNEYVIKESDLDIF